jgi:hypothetical protein
MPKIHKKPIKEQKADFLISYKKNIGLAAVSCQECKITYHTFQKWFKEDPEFRKNCMEVDAVQADYVLNKLLQKIEAGDVACIIFYLKAKLNWRDRTIIQLEGNIDHTMKQISINVIDTDTKLLMGETIKLIDKDGREI